MIADFDAGLSAAELLAALPERVQRDLWDVASAAMGMSREKRATAATVLVGLAGHANGLGADEFETTVQFFSASALVLTGIDRERQEAHRGGA